MNQEVAELTNARDCAIEGCKGVASGVLKITDKETLKELDVCATCYCGIFPQDVQCELCHSKEEIEIIEGQDGVDHLACARCVEYAE